MMLLKRTRRGIRATWAAIFFMKLSSAGKLIYSTYIGGVNDERYLEKIVLDGDGNVYILFAMY